MNNRNNLRLIWRLAALCILGAPSAHAQFFSVTGTGDVIAGFRKTGNFQGANEVVANLGNIVSFLQMPVGSHTNLSVPTTAQFVDAFTNDFLDIQWSVFSTFSGTGVSPWTNVLGVFPGSTIWYTLPCPSTNQQSTPLGRFSQSSQETISPVMLEIANNAANISQNLGSSNAYNNPVLVVEPINGNGTIDLTAGIGDPTTSTTGDFGGNMPVTDPVENTNGNNYSSATRSDFYQSVPSSVTSGHHQVINVDPITGQTNGNAYFIGYFIFNTNGTMTFTRAVSAPPTPTLGITTSGGTNFISFTTTSSVTYALIYTNLAGLTMPRSTWPTLGGSIIGTGATTNFTDTTGAAGRVYSVTAHY